MIRIPIEAIGWFWPLYITFAFFPLLFLFTKLRDIPFNRPNKDGVVFWLLISSFVLTSGTYVFNIALQHGLTAVITPIAGAYPALFVVLAFLIFREKVTWQQLFGIVCTLAGVISLAYIS